ncbi:MAG: bifunctional nuclease family protein [Myxococcota bacterium]
MSIADKPVIPMRVGGIVVDPNTQAPIVILRGIDEPRLYLPIYIGGMEATSIATALADVELPRPMTHDLLVSMLDELCVGVSRITVTDLIDGTFYAEVTIHDEQGHEHVIDARPSDSIAVSLRTGAAVYVAREVLAEAGGMSEEDPEADEQQGEEAEASAGEEQEEPPTGPSPVLGPDVDLEDLDPETFGKYKM